MNPLPLVLKFLGKNSTKILTVAAMVGTITTAAATAKAVNDSKDILHEYDDVEIPLTTKDAVKLTWQNYIPPVIFAGLTLFTIYELNHLHVRGKEALGAAYLLMSKDFKSYQDEVVKMVGEGKNQQILDNQAQTKLSSIQEPCPEDFIQVSRYGGNTLCFDTASSREFISDIELLRRAENEANTVLREQGWISLNEVYDLMGVDRIALGDDLGWHYEDDRLIDFMFSSALSPRGRPSMTINLKPSPKYRDYLRSL